MMSIETYAGYLLRSGLVPEDDVKLLLDRFRREYPSVSGNLGLTDFCEFLVRTEVLSAFQCRMLAERKYKGFFLGEYVILDRGPNENHVFRCQARHILSRELVTLVVNSHDLSFDVFPP